MYWYLSFLRPPPVSVSIQSGSITITPQVANDLRTELRYEPTEIFYRWQRIPTAHASEDEHALFPPRFLTSFIPPGSTYKPIEIPLPKDVRIGEEWRIGLLASSGSSSSPSPGGRLRDLDTRGVIGVWSEGIEIRRGDISSTGVVRGVGQTKSKGKGKEKERERDEGVKQTRITREFMLDNASATEMRLRVVEQTSFDLDKKIWDSGLALSAWLLDALIPLNGAVVHPSSHTAKQDIVDGLRGGIHEETKILEIGSGTGLVSMALALILRRLGRSSRLIATDLDSALDLMNENIALNEEQQSHVKPTLAIPEQPVDSASSESRRQGDKTKGAHVDARLLDWDDPLPDWVGESKWPDLIVAADVTYNTASFPSLLKTLISLLRPASGARPKLLLAYKERDPAERELWNLLRDEGIEMELVEEIKGAEAYGAVEVWIGCVRGV